MQGFTLIEILIVAFIIGMTASLIALSIGDDKTDKAPFKEAQELILAIGFASEHAALNGEVIGMFIAPKETKDSLQQQWCYRWQRLRDNLWGEMPEDTLAEHCMSETVQWELEMEGRLYVYDPDLEIQPPVLVFSPSGEATPVEMAIFEPGATTTSEAQHIEIDMMGNSRWPEQEKQDGR
jgi:general secretion pathway protein H